MAQEHVVCVTVLCDDKKNILPRIVSSWNAIDFGGRGAVMVAVRNDASDQTCAIFENLLDMPVVFVQLENLPSYIQHYDQLPNVRPGEFGVNVIVMERFAHLREAGRNGALSIRLGTEEDAALPDWVFWLDQDIECPPETFLSLHQILTENTGPQAPRVASGLYATRLWGQDITGWIGDGARDYVRVVKDMVQSSRVCGFGCVLMSRQTMEDIPFDSYHDYRMNRQWQMELGRKCDMLGEDIWWLRLAEGKYGVTAVVDNRIKLNHLHDNGWYWEYIESPTDPDLLVTSFNRTQTIPGAGTWVKNIDATPIDLGSYNFKIQPFEQLPVSKEILGTLMVDHKHRIEVLTAVGYDAE